MSRDEFTEAALKKYPPEIIKGVDVNAIAREAYEADLRQEAREKAEKAEMKGELL